MRDYFHKILPRLGPRVVAAAENGEQLVDFYHFYRPDLVITDIKMPHMDGNVLVALDGTPTAEQILQPANELAKVMGSSFTLLRVIPSVVSHNTPKKNDAEAALADKLQSEAQGYLTRISASLRDQGIAAQTRIVTHVYPAMASLEEAATGDYDLISLETHGRVGLPRLFLGSVADKVVRGATVPVLVHRCLPE